MRRKIDNYCLSIITSIYVRKEIRPIKMTGDFFLRVPKTGYHLLTLFYAVPPKKEFVIAKKKIDLYF